MKIEEINKAMKPKKDRIYISGSISGRPLEEAREHFARAERWLQGQDYQTINPLKMCLPVWLAIYCGKTGYKLCLLIELAWLSFRATGIYMLSDYYMSRGAKTERLFAKAIGLPIFYEKIVDKSATDERNRKINRKSKIAKS